MASGIITVVLALLCACGAQEYEEWTKAITEEANLGKEDLVFNCSEFPIHPIPTRFVNEEGESPFNLTVDKPVAWMLPNLTIVWDAGDFGKIHISDNHWQMTVRNVTREDFGIYHCMIEMNSTAAQYYLVKWGLNMRGPYFEDLWDKYRTNTIIGLSACFGFTALMVLIGLIWQYRWQAPEGSTAPDAYTGTQITPYGGGDMVNHGFTHDEPVPTTSSGYGAVMEKPPLTSSGVSAAPKVTYSTINTPEPTLYENIEQDSRF